MEGSEATELSKLSKRAFPSPKTGPRDSPGDGAEQADQTVRHTESSSPHYMDNTDTTDTMDTMNSLQSSDL